MPGFEIIGKEEQEEINKIFEDGGILFAHGFDNIRNNRFRVREFENLFSKYLNVKYSQAVSSGTAALKCCSNSPFSFNKYLLKFHEGF